MARVNGSHALSSASKDSTNQRSSRQRYMLVSAFRPRSRGSGSAKTASQRAAWIRKLLAQAPLAMREVETLEPQPVRSR